MYIHTIGFDSTAEKWNIKLNSYPLAYKVHSTPVATYGRSQLLRFDVGNYLLEDENELLIEGTDFNIGDQYYITGVTFVILYGSDDKTEYWINEGGINRFTEAAFDEATDAKLYALYLEAGKDGLQEFNGLPVDSQIINPTMLRETTLFSTLLEADVSPVMERENRISGSTPALSILEVASEDLSVAQKNIGELADSHQSYVEEYLNQEKFEQVGMVYYNNSINAI